MTDRELLELAAKAAGIEAHDWLPGLGFAVDVRWKHGLSNVERWNPLTDDGDASSRGSGRWIRRALTPNCSLWRARSSTPLLRRQAHRRTAAKCSEQRLKDVSEASEALRLDCGVTK